MGFGSDSDIATVNGPISQQKAAEAMQSDHSMMQMGGAMNPQDVAPNANSIPNFPQDAYMEGPMMAMDNMVEKPENYGLNPGWSGFMQGMMTFVRVLPPDQYDDIMARVRKGEKPSMEGMPGMQDMPGMKM